MRLKITQALGVVLLTLTLLGAMGSPTPTLAGPSCDSSDSSDYKHARTETKDGYSFEGFVSTEEGCELLFEDDLDRIVVNAPDGRAIDLIGRENEKFSYHSFRDFRIENTIPTGFPFVVISYSPGGNSCERFYMFYTKSMPFRRYDEICGYESLQFVPSTVESSPGLLRDHEFWPSGVGRVGTIYIPYVATPGERGFAANPKATLLEFGPTKEVAYELAGKVRERLDSLTKSANAQGAPDVKLRLSTMWGSSMKDYEENYMPVVKLPLSIALTNRPELALDIMGLAWGKKIDRGPEWDDLVNEIAAIQQSFLGKANKN